MRKPGSLEAWETRRMIAANMFEQGKEAADVAAAVGVAAQTVRQWRRVYLKDGRAGLASRKPTGRPARLTDEQRRELADLLAGTPEENGFAGRYLWTQQLIAELIERKFGVRYHHDSLGAVLRKAGVTPQKPDRRARERDEARIAAWRQQVWPGLLKKVPPPPPPPVPVPVPPVPPVPLPPVPPVRTPVPVPLPLPLPLPLPTPAG